MQIQLEELLLQLFRVGQITVMRQHQTKGRVDVERLRLGKVIGRAGGWVAAMRNAPVTRQRPHITGTNTLRIRRPGLCAWKVPPSAVEIPAASPAHDVAIPSAHHRAAG